MRIEGNILTATAGEALQSHCRVKLSGATVVYADATDYAIGVTEYAAANGADVAVRLISAGGSFEIRAGGAIAAGADCKGAADGEIVTGAVATDAKGDQYAAIEAATADQDIIEVIPVSSKMSTDA